MEQQKLQHKKLNTCCQWHCERASAEGARLETGKPQKCKKLQKWQNWQEWEILQTAKVANLAMQ